MDNMFNFSGVEAATQTSNFKFVEPGLHTLTISKVEGKTANSGSPGVTVTFDSKEAEASFNHDFWLSAKALPRIQYIVEKFTGTKMDGQFTSLDQVVQILSAKLVGRTKTVVVDGEKRTREKDGQVYINTYPTLRYAGFVDPEGTDAEPRIADKTASQTAVSASGTVTSSAPAQVVN